jgi:hypothetical protein
MSLRPVDEQIWREEEYARECERAAAVIRRTPIEKQQVYAAADYPKTSDRWTLPTGLMLGLLLGLCFVVGLTL